MGTASTAKTKPSKLNPPRDATKKSRHQHKADQIHEPKNKPKNEPYFKAIRTLTSTVKTDISNPRIVK